MAEEQKRFHIREIPMMTLDGATDVAAAAAQWRFTYPGGFAVETFPRTCRCSSRGRDRSRGTAVEGVDV